jgi:hypothetical protein
MMGHGFEQVGNELQPENLFDVIVHFPDLIFGVLFFYILYHCHIPLILSCRLFSA